MFKPVRVLIIDGSARERQAISQGLAADPGIEVLGTSPDPYVARDMITELLPDVLTLDVEMPRMNGVEFLRRLMPQHPLPVVMVSALTEIGKRTTLDALEAGAVDFVTKPRGDTGRALDGMLVELRAKIKIAAAVNVSHLKNKRPALRARAVRECKDPAEPTDRVIAIGASTGGTEAIRNVLTRFPSTTPGVVIVQHMPAGMTELFAERLNTLCAMEVRQARTGDRIISGRALLAPGGLQMTIRRSRGAYEVECESTTPECGHCPSVEVLFRSVAKHVGVKAVGIMLTGMGHDGADAMVAMRRAGARTVAQDEASSVVFGMPKEAYSRGGAERLLPLDRIGGAVLEILTEERLKPSPRSSNDPGRQPQVSEGDRNAEGSNRRR